MSLCADSLKKRLGGGALDARGEVALRVLPDGRVRVRALDLSGRDAREPTFRACVERSFRRWRLDPAVGAVAFPIAFL